MSIGSNIKAIRQFRNLTQKELGKLLGFSDITADVRIAQYESNKKKPKESLISKMAEELHVSPLAINSEGVDAFYYEMMTLLLLAEKYNLTIDEIDGEPIIRVGKFLHDGKSNEFYHSSKAWLKKAKQLHNDEITRDEYLEWIYNYPIAMLRDERIWLYSSEDLPEQV